MALLLLAPGAGRGKEWDVAWIRQGYREVLTRLAAGDGQAALTSLSGLEARAVEGRVEREVAELWRAKLQVIRALLDAGQGNDVLLPIIVLHHDAYLMYRQREERILAAHARDMAVDLAQFYVRQGPPAAGKQAAARVLASFAGYLADGQATRSSVGLYTRALEIDPDNRAALLGLAALHEKLGDYAAALPHLQRAAALNPEDRETALRLALCLKRSGDPERAQSLLEGLLPAEAPEWIAVLAYQELAALHLEAGRLGAAEAVLRQGLERFPADDRLGIQAAFVLDRNRRGAEALQLLESLVPAAKGAVSPRFQYGRWPEPPLAECRSRLAQDAASRLAPLGAAAAAARLEGFNEPEAPEGSVAGDGEGG